MGTEEDVRRMGNAGVKRQFARWAISYLSGSGYDYKTVDIEAYYDDTLSFGENKQLLKQLYPSKPEQKITHSEVNAGEAQAYEAAAIGRKEEKKEFAEAEIEKSTKVNRNIIPNAEGIDEDINEFETKEEVKEKGFLDKVKGAYSEFKSSGEEKKEIKDKERKFKSEQKIKELDAESEQLGREKEVREKQYLTTKEKIKGMKEQVFGGPAAKALKEEIGIGERSRRASNVNMFGTNPINQRDSQGTASKSFLNQRNILQSAGPQRSQGQGGQADRLGLDVFARPQGQRRESAILRSANVNAARQDAQKQKYNYITVIEKGVARRERVPIKEEGMQEQRNPLEKFNLSPRRNEVTVKRKQQEVGNGGFHRSGRSKPTIGLDLSLGNILGTRKAVSAKPKPKKEINFFGRSPFKGSRFKIKKETKKKKPKKKKGRKR